MKTIKLEDGREVQISDESYKAFEDAVKKFTYEDVWNILKPKHYFDNMWKIHDLHPAIVYSEACECNLFRKERMEQIKALAKLMNVADYLNKGCSYDIMSVFGKHHWEMYCTKEWELGVICRESINYGVCFYSREAAEKAIEILGEDVIITALGGKL